MTKPSAGTSPPFVRPSASAFATASPDASPSTTASARSTITRCSPRIPSSARPLANEITGLLPEWIVYHELVATTRVFLRNVCAVEAPWVGAVTERLREVDLKRLSGGRVATRKAREEEARMERAKEAERRRIESGARKNDDKAVDDARARYLARKAAAEKAKK